MTTTANFIGTLQDPVFYVFSGTTTVDVETISAKNTGLTLSDFSFTNTTASAVECQIFLYDGTNERIIWMGSVAAKSTAPDFPKPVRTAAGSVIRAKSASATGVTLHLNFISQLGVN